MEYFFEKTQYPKIFGNLIRDERKFQKKSAQVVAQLAGLSQQYLSEIERGKRSASDETIMQLCSVLKVKFNFNDDMIRQADIIFNKIIRAIGEYDHENLQVQVKKLEDSIFKYSYAYSYYQCAHLIEDFFLLKKHPESKPDLNIIETNLPLYIFIKYLNGLFFQDLEEIDEGLSINNIQSNLLTETIKCLLWTQKASYYVCHHKYSDALQFYEKAAKLGHAVYLNTHSLNIELQVANVHSQMGHYQTSTAHYSRIIVLADLLNNTYIKHAARFNQAYNHMISGEYHDVLINLDILMNEISDPSNEFSPVYYLLAYTHLMLGNETKASEYCLEALNLIAPSDFQYKMISLIVLCFKNQQNKDIFNNILDSTCDRHQILDYFAEIMKSSDPGDVTIMYHLLMHYLKTQDETSTALSCSESYIHYLESIN